MSRVDCGRGPWLPSLGSKCLDPLTTYPEKRVLVACRSPMPTETAEPANIRPLRNASRGSPLGPFNEAAADLALPAAAFYFGHSPVVATGGEIRPSDSKSALDWQLPLLDSGTP